jgi:predicted RNase H-like nuclease (RuvC/YqgF family)
MAKKTMTDRCMLRILIRFSERRLKRLEQECKSLPRKIKESKREIARLREALKRC